MRICDWSSDVCSSDLRIWFFGRDRPFCIVVSRCRFQRPAAKRRRGGGNCQDSRQRATVEIPQLRRLALRRSRAAGSVLEAEPHEPRSAVRFEPAAAIISPLEVPGEALEIRIPGTPVLDRPADIGGQAERSEEHTSELKSLMRSSYAVFCLK